MKIVKKFKDFFIKKKSIPPIDPIPSKIPEDLRWISEILAIQMNFRFDKSNIGQSKANDEESFFSCLLNGELRLGVLHFRKKGMIGLSSMTIIDSIEMFRQDFTKFMNTDTVINMERIVMICEENNVVVDYEQQESNDGYWPYVKVTIGEMYQYDKNIGDIIYSIYKMVYR